MSHAGELAFVHSLLSLDINWIARDRNGFLFGYHDKPKYNAGSGYIPSEHDRQVSLKFADASPLVQGWGKQAIKLENLVRREG